MSGWRKVGFDSECEDHLIFATCADVFAPLWCPDVHCPDCHPRVVAMVEEEGEAVLSSSTVWRVAVDRGEFDPEAVLRQLGYRCLSRKRRAFAFIVDGGVVAFADGSLAGGGGARHLAKSRWETVSGVEARAEVEVLLADSVTREVRMLLTWAGEKPLVSVKGEDRRYIRMNFDVTAGMSL